VDVTVPEPTTATAHRGRLARAGLLTLAATAGTLLVNVVTGVLIARVLGPSGRGAVTAVLAAPVLVAWLFGMGCAAAATYHQSRHPDDAPRLVSTWLVLGVPLALMGIVVGELLLPHLLAAQSEHTLFLARLLMLTLALTFLGDLMNGIVLGDQDFVFYNAVRVVQPLAVAVAYAALWVGNALTVTTAVAATVAVSAACALGLSARVLRRHGLARPSRALGRTTLWYGARAHSTFTAGLVNTRLDVMIIPAFVGASTVGLYSVATSVSWIVVTVAGSIGAIVFPAAAARGPEGRYIVLKSLYATLAVGVLLAGVVAAVAGVGVELVYGPDFAGSVEPLRVLLAGAVLYAAAGTVCAGLYALDRPFTAAVAQLCAAAFTVAGLTLFLRDGGIQAAAIVSTAAYALVFVIATALWCRAAGLRWRELFPAPSRMALWMREATRAGVGRA
jgi:O-antigen/teichoic acid export membrane protein